MQGRIQKASLESLGGVLGGNYPSPREEVYLVGARPPPPKKIFFTWHVLVHSKRYFLSMPSPEKMCDPSLTRAVLSAALYRFIHSRKCAIQMSGLNLSFK